MNEAIFILAILFIQGIFMLVAFLLGYFFAVKEEKRETLVKNLKIKNPLKRKKKGVVSVTDEVDMEKEERRKSEEEEIKNELRHGGRK